MVFRDEKLAVEQLSELLFEASKNLFITTMYIYALPVKSYYNCDVKDILRVVFNNIRNTDCLNAFHLDIDDSSCAVINSPEYKKVLWLIIYSFAVRLPALCHTKVGNDRMTDQQIAAVYQSLIRDNMPSVDAIISEKYVDIRTLVRKGKPLPPYNAEWFRSYLYGTIPALADISNRNLFFFGALDVLFYLFYLRLSEEFESCIQSLCAN